MPDIFFLKKFVRCPCDGASQKCRVGATIALTFFVETVAASFVSVLAPIAKFGFKKNPVFR